MQLIQTLLNVALVAALGGVPLAENTSPQKPSEPSVAYEKMVLNEMLKEANEYAKRLSLPETLPITTLSLKEVHISPSAIASRFGALGSFRTEHFSYGFGKGRKLCYITRRAKDNPQSLYDQHKHLAISPSMVNTNSAYVMATQWLGKVFVDLPRLSRNATLSVEPWRILGMTTAKYTVEWQEGGKPTAQVTLIEPTAELVVLRVEQPQYILRPGLLSGVLENVTRDSSDKH